MITDALISKRFHLDNEIRELIQFANDEYGESGVIYTREQIAKITELLLSDSEDEEQLASLLT